ncbi:dead deah box helicase [Botrytis cinerea]
MATSDGVAVEVHGTTQLPNSILSWYDETRPMWIDLVGDYAGKELFLLEGDSLLRECFADERIDFQGNVSYVSIDALSFDSPDGFQLLHAVYVVERFLENLVKRHCNFHIAFFEENRQLCVPPGVKSTRRARYLLARTAIRQHLHHKLPLSHPEIVINTFPSLESKEFSDYLHVTPIHFVMSHDGAATAKQPRSSKEAKTILRGLIWFFNSQKLNIALINRIEFIDSKVFTMIVESMTVSSQRKLLISSKFTKDIEEARVEFAKDSQPDSSSGMPSIDDETTQKLSAASAKIHLSERSCVSVLSASHILKENTSDIFFASALILQSVMLNQIPLSKRRFPSVEFDNDFEKEITSFLSLFADAAQAILNDPTWSKFVETNEISRDSHDLIDGRLFRVVIQAMCDESLDPFPQSIQDEWLVLCNLTKELSSQELSLDKSVDLSSVKVTPCEDSDSSSDDLTVLPFTNAVFNKHLECIHVETDSSLSTKFGTMKLYRETSHWHNHKKPLITKAPVAQKVSKWREMTSYAASLTGAKGKALEPETIVVGPKQLVKVAEEKPSKSSKVEKPASKSKKEAPADKGTKKGGGLSAADQIRAANLEKKGDTETDKAFLAWSMIMKDLDLTSNDENRYLRAKQYLNNLDNARTKILEGDINTFILQCLQSWWQVALIWTTVRSICTTSAPITKEIIQHVEKICKLVGISDAFSSPKILGADRKLSFAFKYPPPTLSLKIDISQSEFQLEHCGPYMDRMLDAKPDPVDVLDQLDANKSVFVVAPTSAGKTFISFYAMEQILRADNDGVLVYVAPTKALVNQIAAEVQGRFSKRFPQAGKGVWAIHTRDYRVNNSTGCQILVTVPHILQIMLLSPTNAKSWAPRVKRIIFDEIHSIGQSEDGVVWEQLLLLSPCPIIALSATVGNPEQFADWLGETQKANGSELKMIKHSTRYSDLRKFMYEPPKKFNFEGLGDSFGLGLGLDGLQGFEPFHPVSSLVDPSRGMPEDLALEPRDCLSLWKAMVKHQSKEYSVPESVNPEKALPSCIRKADIFAWEKNLKKILLQWMTECRSQFANVVKELTPENSEIKNDISIDGSYDSATELIDPLDLQATTLPLLYQLHKRRALPAILFNYDRSACESIANTLLSQLEMKAKKGRKPVKPTKKSNQDDEGGSKMDRMPDFSFADPKRLQKEELDGFIRQLRRKEIREDLIDLLKRGIGVHHAGMNRKYRQCVEMLFRKGFLRVVIATGTLSLGINMPCATVVFSGDSVFLTALNFRQAAGRSGRRGFDLLGNVVFQGVSRERASRLLSSRLPELTGHFPITTTLNSPYAVRAINSLLSQPRLYLGGQSFREQVLHHLRFSIEYLRRNALLGPGGEPVNFTSCVSHLYFTENSSFAFHALLNGKYFHKLCADIDTNSDEVLRTMVLVLSHLFGRRVVREVDDPEEAEKIHRSPSNSTLEVFSTYVKTFAEQHITEDEHALPFTQSPVGPNEANKTNENTTLDFLPSLPSPHARSPFVALSGLGDSFTTIEDLCSSTREGVFLEAAVIPHLELHPDETRSPLNSYLLDFFKHGSLQPLEDANGIRRSDVWFVLNDFSMVLATIATSLALHLGLGQDTDSELLDVMGAGDSVENENDEKMAEDSIPQAASGPPSEVQQAQPVRRKKVVDDWDAGEDRLAAEEDYLEKEKESGAGATDDEEYEKLMNVYRAFRKLKTEFDEKFRAIWA